jgi:peptide subunit release factor 1 (eRF1)
MIESHIKQLASRPDSHGPFVTLYIDTARVDEAHKDRIRLFVKHEAQNLRESIGEKGNGLDQAIRQIESYVENSLQPETRGLAIFAAPHEEFFASLQLPVAVRPQLAIGSRPHLRQLAELRQYYPTAALAMIDAKSARLFVLGFGRILDEIDVENPEVPKKHDQGGWSQANLQRHTEEVIDRHHQKVADVLTKLFDQGGFNGGVILSGQERNVANFRTFLPKRVTDAVIGTLHLDIRTPVGEVSEACGELIAETTRLRTVEKVRVLESGKGALGFAKVVAALNERRVGQLFVARHATGRGWKCTACGIIGAEVPLGCPACGESVRTCDLIEAIISLAETEQAEVETVDAGTIIDRNDGVGATLRF